MKLKKIFAVMLAMVMLATGTAVGAYAAGDVDYKINSTYANVDWSTVNQYKSDLHSHSTVSDGDQTIRQQVEKHYEHGFDIMALSDHGTVDYGWDKDTEAETIRVVLSIKEGNRPIDPLKASGTTDAGAAYTYADDYYKQYDENGNALHTMMRVPFANEQNPTSFNNAHVNTWFVDYGNDVVGGTSDYETPIRNVDKLGGLSIINHPGEYSNARDEECYEDAYDMNNIHYKYVVNKFANLLLKYDSCLGIDINSKGDGRTRFDRKLWDILLQKVVPHGRNVYAIATSDAHNPDIVNSGYTWMCMPELTTDALRACMENGEFFAASYYMGSREEIKAWASELAAAGIAPEFAAELQQTYETIVEEEKNGGQDTKFEFDQTATVPKVTGVAVNDTEDTITLSTKDAYLVHWIADGEFIATGNTIDLDDYSDKIGSYVRAEVIGEGGVIYTQAFTLEYDGAPEAEKEFFLDLGLPATLICDTLVKALAFVLRFTGIIALGNLFLD